MGKSKLATVKAVCGKEVLLSSGGWVKSRYTPRIDERVRVDKHGFVVPAGKQNSNKGKEETSASLVSINNDTTARTTGLRLGQRVTNPEVQYGESRSADERG